MTFETVVVGIFTGIIGGEAVNMFNGGFDEWHGLLVVVSSTIVFMIVKKHNKKELKND